MIKSIYQWYINGEKVVELLGIVNCDGGEIYYFNN